jgi:alpha-galactosidase/6-phospho-beta-glucosidase family protein
LIRPGQKIEYTHFSLGEHHFLHEKEVKKNPNSKETKSSSTLVECIGMAAAIVAFAPILEETTLIVVCDNSGAIQNVNRGYSRNEHIAMMLTAIGCAAVRFAISVRGVQKPRAFLDAADALSRGDVTKFKRLALNAAEEETVVQPAMLALLLNPDTDRKEMAKAIMD